MEKNIEENISENLFRFWENRGIREAILCVRIMMEKSKHVKKTLYVALVYLEKAFDNVVWKKMIGLLENLRIDYNDRRIIHQLYERQVAKMQMRGGRRIEAKINKGVRQRCNLSHCSTYT
jgi:hypothetical protein